MRKLLSSIAAAALVASLPASVSAQQVSVSSKDGSVKLVGDVLSFSDQQLVLQTQFGQLTLERALVTCEGDACPEDKFKLDVTVAMVTAPSAPLLQRLALGFAAQESLIAEQVDANGSMQLAAAEDGADAGAIKFEFTSVSASFDALQRGDVNFVLSPVPVPSATADAFVAGGQFDPRAFGNETVLALDAVVPVVHPRNLARSVSLAQMAGVLSGDISNWSQLGGQNAPIEVILPTAGTPDDQVLTQVLYQPAGVSISSQAQRTQDQSDAVNAVNQNPNAITLASISNQGGNKVLPLRQTCGPLAYATDFTLRAEEYPLRGRYYLYKNVDALSTSERAFLDYVTSEEAQTLIGNDGFIGQNVVSEPISLQGTRLTSAITSASDTDQLLLVQNFSDELATADRLSTTFRFETGSARLDNKSLDDLARMVAFLNSPEAQGRQVTVIGFSDAVGRFDLNERLSFLRANGLRTALIEASGDASLADRITVSSYGPLAPVACNDTAAGREGNRRVEVWLQ